ncbi:MAG: DUF4157 domain-containing protein [Pseudomonadota bacterium]
MAIGPARDRFEAEADRAANHVMAGRAGAPSISPVSAGAGVAAAVAMRMPSADEEETVQRAVKDEAEEETIQRAVKEEAEEETIQRDAAGFFGASASPRVEAGVRAARGGGAPLAGDTRSRMEAGFGRDFGAVRIHDDARAARLNDEINAHAFTTGSDIFFGAGRYAPGTERGARLLAHELTHVAQQTGPGIAQPKRIQRNGDGATPSNGSAGAPPPDPPPPPLTWPETGIRNRGVEVNEQGEVQRFVLPSLKLPKIGNHTKGRPTNRDIQGGFDSRLGHTGQFIPSSEFLWRGQGDRSVEVAGGGEDTTRQDRLWDQYIDGNASLQQKIEDEFQGAPPDIRRLGTGPRVYYLQLRGRASTGNTLIGTAEELAADPRMKRPLFGHLGRFAFLEVDHWIGVQHGGAHTIGNMWLLDKATNAKEGGIPRKVSTELGRLATDASNLWQAHGKSAPTFSGWPDNVEILFKRVSGEPVGAYQSWDKTQIKDGDHLKKLRPMTDREMATAGLKFDPNVTPARILVFNSATSTFRKTMNVANGQLTYSGGNRDFISGFDLTSATYHMPPSLTPGFQVATLSGTAFPSDASADERANPGVGKALNVPVIMTADHGFGGYIDTDYINAQMRAATGVLPGMSPITIEQAGLSEDWSLGLSGTVRSDLPIIDGFVFGIRVLGDAVYIDVDVPVEALKLGPFEATEATLTAGYDSEGPLFGGSVAFQIAGVGSGSLTAARTSFSGDFNFDIDAFDPAMVNVTYADGVWSGSASLGIKPGVIPFVEQGTIVAGLDEGGDFFLTGAASLAGPGIPEGAELTVAYNQETGAFTFGGEVPLDTSRLPGLTNARVGFAVSRAEDGTYSVSGDGSAAFALSGVTGSVDIGYRDGILTANGEAAIVRPPLTGSANFHLSNQAVDEVGQPIEGPPLEEFRAWGGGEASIQFGDYITATAGIQFLENGEIELLGRIALPPSIELIQATDYHYDIFTFPEVRFPIIGFTIPVVNRSFGVFGFVRGGLDANLTVGPGELVDSEVEVSYNPDHPEDMSITGGSTFQIGASADVGLRVTGGVGAGLAIVEATGEIGLRGAIGLELSGGAAVQLDWTPLDGLSIDASVFGEAQPTFSISLVADARVVVDAVLWSGTLWNESWERELASIGPDMLWRAELPASWSERDGLDLDINNLELTYPDIDLGGLAEDVFDAVVR